MTTNSGNENFLIPHRPIEGPNGILIRCIAGLAIEFRQTFKAGHHFIGFAIAELTRRNTFKNGGENIVDRRAALRDNLQRIIQKTFFAGNAVSEDHRFQKRRGRQPGMMSAFVFSGNHVFIIN